MQLQYELSSSDVVAARRLFLWRRRRLYCWGYTLFSAAFFLFGVFNLIMGLPDLAVVPLVMGAFGTLYLPLIAPYRSARRLLGAGKKIIHMAVADTPEGIVISTRLSRSSLRWEAFSDFIEGPTVWLLFVNPLSYHIIPTRAFLSEADKAQFRADLLRANPKLASR